MLRVPAAGGACREDGRITATAPDVENVLPSWICAAASNRAVSRPRIRSHRSRCSMKCLPLAPFQSSACSAFTATKDTLYRPAILPGPVPDAPSGTFVMGGSDHRNHPALARKLQACLRWRNAHARHPGVLAAQRRERARIRSERQQRWGRPKPKAA